MEFGVVCCSAVEVKRELIYADAKIEKGVIVLNTIL